MPSINREELARLLKFGVESYNAFARQYLDASERAREEMSK
jgi:hypothetical protein